MYRLIIQQQLQNDFVTTNVTEFDNLKDCALAFQRRMYNDESFCLKHHMPFTLTKNESYYLINSPEMCPRRVFIQTIKKQTK